jgi:DNA-binding transcriptional ArsR family regulator
MSVKAMEWAISTDLKNNAQKLVLMILAHSHNGKTGQCNPRVETIARGAGLSERAVKRALKELREMGYVHSARRRRGPRQASNHYVLALDGVVFQCPDKPQKSEESGCRSCHPDFTNSGTLYVEQEVEQERARPTNVVKVEFGESNSGRVDRTASVSQVDISRSAEKGENRNRSG